MRHGWLMPLPQGVSVRIEGAVPGPGRRPGAHRPAGGPVPGAGVSVLYGRYRSVRLVAMVMVGSPSPWWAVLARAVRSALRWRRLWGLSPSPASPPATASSRSATTCTCIKKQGEAFGDADRAAPGERLTPAPTTALTRSPGPGAPAAGRRCAGQGRPDPVAVVIFGGLASEPRRHPAQHPALRRYGGPALIESPGGECRPSPEPIKGVAP